jgi:flagellar hook-basal body complex protein FliE
MVLPIRAASFPVVELANASLGKAGSGGASGGASGGIGGIGGATGIGKMTGTSGLSSEGSATDFTAKLREVLNEANQPQVRAETASQDYANGKQNDLHGTMITMAEADISLRLVSNVRNRVIEAYREVMRMGS